MTLSANTVFEVRTDGNDANGGGFVSGASGTDRSQQAAAHATLTTAATVHTTTTQINVPAGEHTVAAADVGNLFRLTGGTATAGWYQITAADVGNNRWTLDRSAGTAGQTAPGKMGGALGSPGGLGAVFAAHGVDGQRGWLKSGTYTLSNTTANTAGGPLHLPNNIRLVAEGYETTRGDRAAKPTLDAGAQTAVTLWKTLNTNTGDQQCLLNLKADGNDGADVIGFDGGSTHNFIKHCEAVDCATGFQADVESSKATSCTTGFKYFGARRHGAKHCRADACTTGFLAGSDQSCVHDSLATNCVTGFDSGSWQRLYFGGCLADGCSGDGFVIVNNGVASLCVSTNNGGYGFNLGGAAAYLVDCYEFNNTSGATNLTSGVHQVTALTADPFVDSANGDYNINDTAGGGAVLRAVEVPL